MGQFKKSEKKLIYLNNDIYLFKVIRIVHCIMFKKFVSKSMF